MSEVVKFFNSHAEKWDSYQKEDDFATIEDIFKRAEFYKKDKILDVGAGTGVLVPFFIKYNLLNFTAIDISPRMVEIYKSKYPGREIIVSDYEDKIFILDAIASCIDLGGEKISCKTPSILYFT